jgi:hypothetical protein
MNAITCDNCGLRQWVPASGQCRRCRKVLKLFIEIPLTAHSKTPGNEHSPNLSFGPAIRAMRLRQGKTQYDVSSSAQKLQRSTLSRVESNACAPSLSTLARILHALGAEAIYIRFAVRPDQDRY